MHGAACRRPTATPRRFGRGLLLAALLPIAALGFLVRIVATRVAVIGGVLEVLSLRTLFPTESSASAPVSGRPKSQNGV